MATRTWLGGASAVAQVDTLTVGGTVEATDVFSVTLTDEGGNAQTEDVVAGSTDIDTVAGTIADAINAAGGLFTKVTAADTSGTTTGTLTITSDTAGVPFRCTVATTETGGGAADAQTFTRAATTASSGPSDYGVAANWTGGAVPVANDDVVIQGTSDILYSLDQSGVETDSFKIAEGYSGTIGSQAARLHIDMGDSEALTIHGAGTYYLDVSDAAVSPTVRMDLTQSECHLKGTALTDVNFSRGELFLEGCTVNSSNDINQSYVSSSTGDSTLYVDADCTLTSVDIKKSGGNATIEVAFGTITNEAGTATLNGSGAVTTITCTGGTAYSNTSGTVTNAYADGGVIDFTRSAVSRTVTNSRVESGGSIIANPNVMTFTNVTTGRSTLTTSA